MPAASLMADDEQDLGAPIAKDAIDPDLVKLKRARPKIGVITCAGVVFLCLWSLVKLDADRRFAGEGDQPAKVAVSDILAGKVGADRYVTLQAEPVIGQAIRSTAAKGTAGLRVAPARGTGDRLWLVISGNGWDAPTSGSYTGRLRRLSDLPLAASVRDFAATQPRPVFATADEVRAASGTVKTVTGDAVAVGDADKVAYDIVDPHASVIVCALNERLTSAAAWQQALAAAGLTVTPRAPQSQEEVSFDVAEGADAVTTKLEAAKLWAARVEPVTHHAEKTWHELKTAIPPELDLVGIYVARGIPGDAYALITGERPDAYWYVLPVTIVVVLIGLLFAWALVRAVKRDLLPA